jgi:acyl carrier protein
MNDEATIFDRVCATVRAHLCLDADRTLTRASHIADDLGADSLDTLELAMACEEQFGVDLLDPEIEGIRTVGDLVGLVERKKGIA